MMSSTIRGAAAATKIAVRSSSRLATVSVPAAGSLPPINPAQEQLQSPQLPWEGKHGAADLHKLLKEDELLYSDFAYSLSFADDESDFNQNFEQLFLDETMREQLAISKNQLRNYGKKTVQKSSSVAPDLKPLPRTIQDALRHSSRAIVITEAVKPFRIVNVNKAWEDLCGYSYVEAKGKTLGSLLRGPETDTYTGTSLIAQLLRGEEAGATLTNYTKDNRAFRNRLQVGPLMDGLDVTHFVGVLQEV